MSTPPPSESILSANPDVFSRNATVVSNEPVHYETAKGYGKNFFILILVAMLILSFLGINILAVAGQWIEKIAGIITPTLGRTFSMFTYSTGEVIDKTSETVAKVAKTGIDIADGAIDDVGQLLKKGSGITSSGDKLPESAPVQLTGPEPDQGSNPIQNPIAAAKSAWCLVGEDNGKRGCVEIGEADKCMSGQIFPSQKVCLNPTYTVSQYAATQPK